MHPPYGGFGTPAGGGGEDPDRKSNHQPGRSHEQRKEERRGLKKERRINDDVDDALLANPGGAKAIAVVIPPRDKSLDLPVTGKESDVEFVRRYGEDNVDWVRTNRDGNQRIEKRTWRG